MASHPSDIRRLSTHTFRKSLFEPAYDSPDMIYGVYAGNLYPLINDDDLEEKYWVLRRKCAIFDVPERPIEITGPDACRYLERIMCRPLADLKIGRGRYAIACTHEGGVFMDGVVFHLSENRYWYVQADGEMDAWFAAHIDGFDVTVTDPSARVLQIQGPTSFKVMEAASDGAITWDMKYFHAGFVSLGGQEVYVSRTGWTGELGYEVYTQAGTDHMRLWNHLMDAGAPHGMEFATADPMETRRIEAGILDNLVDMDATMTPFAAGLGAFVNLDHPGFIGREALLGANQDVALYGLTCEAHPLPGAQVTRGDHAVGRITNGAWSLTLKCGVGYVRFDTAHNWIGQSLQLIQPDGTAMPCEICALPFFDAEKRLARGLTFEL
ncbi:MAG: aminomethyltransferase family protein [Pseudomonadota bacterium]